MGWGSPLLLLLASATSQWALVGCNSVVSAPLRNAPLGCVARVLGLPRSNSATRITPAGTALSVKPDLRTAEIWHRRVLRRDCLFVTFASGSDRSDTCPCVPLKLLQPRAPETCQQRRKPLGGRYHAPARLTPPPRAHGSKLHGCRRGCATTQRNAAQRWQRRSRRDESSS